MNLFVILLVVVQHTRQYEFASDSLNMDCGKPLISLVQPQAKTDENDLGNDYHIKNIFRINKEKYGQKKGKKAVAVPVLLMSNSAFSDIKGSTFNFKDIDSFKIDQGSDSDQKKKLHYEDRPRDPQKTNHKHRHRKPKYDERPTDPEITNDKDRHRKPKYDERPRDPEITNDDDLNGKLEHDKRPRYPKTASHKHRHRKPKYDDGPRDNNVQYYDNIIYLSKYPTKHKHNEGYKIILGKLSKK